MDMEFRKMFKIQFSRQETNNDLFDLRIPSFSRNQGFKGKISAFDYTNTLSGLLLTPKKDIENAIKDFFTAFDCLWLKGFLNIGEIVQN